MKINPIYHPIIFQIPGFTPSSPLLSNIPFVLYLVDLLQPDMFIELGVTDGVSFFSFCQSASLLNLKTNCYGVSSLKGELKPAAFDENLRKYSHFAKLVESSVEEFLENIPDHAIDLLKISKIDEGNDPVLIFNKYQAKLSSRSLVLVDNIIEDNFIFWSYLKNHYPTMELNLKSGLGVAVVGNSPAPAVQELVSSDAEEREKILNFFSQFGLLVSKSIEDGIRNEGLERQLSVIRQQLSERVQDVIQKDHELHEIYISKAWKLASFIRNLRVRVIPPNSKAVRLFHLAKKAPWVLKHEGPKSLVRAVIRKAKNLSVETESNVPVSSTLSLSPAFPTPNFDVWYSNWIAENEPNAGKLSEQKELAKNLLYQPKISLLVPVYNTPLFLLDALIDCVKNQTYENWELCLVDGNSNDARVRALIDGHVAIDSRIQSKYLQENLGISGNTNVALKMATGEYIYLVDHDDLIPPFALYEIVKLINEHPETLMIYGDEDKITVDGLRHQPFFKPDWSPDLLQAFMYVGHSVYKKSIVEEVGGFRSEFDFSQDYDLALRVTEKTDQVGHISKVLYHWRTIPQSAAAGGKDFARESNIAALADAVKRRGFAADVLALPSSNCIKFHWIEKPLISIIIPTDDEKNALISLEAILSKTDYENFEILVVINSATGALVKEQHRNNDRVRIIPYDKPYNFSAKCNEGVKHAEGEFVLFMNDDVYPTESDWLDWMLGPFQQKEVGAVSPKLIYSNGTVQHAGLVSGVRGFFGTAFHAWYKDTGFYNNLLLSPRTVSALTAACMLMRKSVFEEVEGFDAINTPIMHSDLDLCYKIRDAGLRLVYTPYATLEHVGHQSLSKVEAKGIKHSNKADMFMLKRWTRYVDYDPYYPQNMRDMLYLDSPEKVRTYFGDQTEYLTTKKDVLILSHDLTYSGAPLMALQQARILRDAGWFVTVIAPSDGEMREHYQQLNIPLVIDPLVLASPERLGYFIRDYDLVIGNTITAWPILRFAKAMKKKVLWCVHESDQGCQQAENIPAIRETLSIADRVIFPANQTLSKYRRFELANNFIAFPCGIDLPDAIIPFDFNIESVEKIVVVNVGSVEPRKGQDLMVQAIVSLPKEDQEKFEFYFVGRVLIPEFQQDLLKKTAAYPNVHWVGQVPPADALRYIAASDILVCSSRDETGPLVVFEAMGLKKTVISTPVGVVPEMIDPGKNGFLYPVQDVNKLASILLEVSQGKVCLEQIGTEARATFEKHMTTSRFKKDFLAVLREINEEAG